LAGGGRGFFVGDLGEGLEPPVVHGE
jgi:hypothetical protein